MNAQEVRKPRRLRGVLCLCAAALLVAQGTWHAIVSTSSRSAGFLLGGVGLIVGLLASQMLKQR